MSFTRAIKKAQERKNMRDLVIHINLLKSQIVSFSKRKLNFDFPTVITSADK